MRTLTTMQVFHLCILLVIWILVKWDQYKTELLERDLDIAVSEIAKLQLLQAANESNKSNEGKSKCRK